VLYVDGVPVLAGYGLDGTSFRYFAEFAFAAEATFWRTHVVVFVFNVHHRRP
jgi:hypothetical protein